MENPATPSEQKPTSPSDAKGKKHASQHREVCAGILLYIGLLTLSLFCILFTRYSYNRLPTWVSEFQASLRDGLPKEFKAKSDVYADEPFAYVVTKFKTNEVIPSHNTLQRFSTPYFILDNPALRAELKDQKGEIGDFFTKILPFPKDKTDNSNGSALRHIDVAGAANVILFPYGKNREQRECFPRRLQFVQTDERIVKEGDPLVNLRNGSPEFTGAFYRLMAYASYHDMIMCREADLPLFWMKGFLVAFLLVGFTFSLFYLRESLFESPSRLSLIAFCLALHILFLWLFQALFRMMFLNGGTFCNTLLKPQNF